MDQTPAPATTNMPNSDERLWAMLAHLSYLLNFVTGLLGLVAAFIIYLIYRDRSAYIARQALQSTFFQLITWVGGGTLVAAAWVISSILTVVGIGCLLMPFALLLTIAILAAPVYAVVGAIDCNAGRDFNYWLVGDWIK
jgi:hypothetical protein